MPNGKRRYGQSRRDLAEVAIRLFEERGFTNTTVEQIAEAGDYSPRTFHRQFPAKEDAVFFDLPDILSPLEALIETSVPSAWDAVCAIVVDNAAHWEAASPELAERRTRMFHEEPALYRRFLEICTEWESVIARVFAAERGTDPATDDYSLVLAGCVVGACRAAFKAWLAAPGESLALHTSAGLGLIARGFGLSDTPSR